MTRQKGVSEFLGAWSTTEHMTAREWDRIVTVLGGRTRARARNGGNTRQFVNAVLWVARTRACWSDVPPAFGSWRGIYVRFLRWMRSDQWHPVVDALDEGQTRKDLEQMIDAYMNKGIARDMRRKVLAAEESIASNAIDNA